MKIVGIIPARYGSTRFEGKPLADIFGKPMIQWVYERSRQAKCLSDLIVATDDLRIKEAVEKFGGKAVTTSEEHRSGTDRIAEAAQSLEADIIVNIQGDEPLIEPEMIEQGVSPFLIETRDQKSARSLFVMSTLMTKIKDEAQLQDPNVVKVVVDRFGFALYFSRLPIPYIRDKSQISNLRSQICYKHIGLYVYRKEFLLKIAQMPPTPLELAESLEQLRVLENGYKIKVVETQYDSVGVDTWEDLEKVKRIIKSGVAEPFA